jgi:S1-C subfamily serine protease
MLTADHVIRYASIIDDFEADAIRGDVRLEDGEVFARHPEEDAAILVFHTDKPVAFVKMRRSSVKLMEDLYSAGYAGSREEMWISCGVASGEGRATCQAAPGDSGGAVLDSKGRLVGIIRALDVYRGDLVYHHLRFTPLTDVQDWIDVELFLIVYE